MDLIGKEKVGVSEFCEHGNENLRLINGRCFWLPGRLSDLLFFKKDPAARNYRKQRFAPF